MYRKLEYILKYKNSTKLYILKVFHNFAVFSIYNQIGINAALVSIRLLSKTLKKSLTDSKLLNDSLEPQCCHNFIESKVYLVKLNIFNYLANYNVWLM